MMEEKSNLKSVREIFADEYNIPECSYWTLEQCEMLWKDLIYAYEIVYGFRSKFLGIVYLTPRKDGAYDVEDGQKRIVVLQVLLKALLSKAPTSSAKAVSNLCLKNAEEQNTKEIYEFFVQKIVEYLQENTKKNTLKHLTNYLLDDVLMFLVCPGDEDMLEEFLLKNRPQPKQEIEVEMENENEDGDEEIGEDFSEEEDEDEEDLKIDDRDIYVGDLYKTSMYLAAVKNNKRTFFLEQWKALEYTGKIDGYLENVFFLCHPEFAHLRDVSIHEETIAKFFLIEKPELLRDKWKWVIEKSKMMQYIRRVWKDEDDEVGNLWNIMTDSKTLYWEIPLMVFLNKYGSFENGKFSLPKQYLPFFRKFMGHSAAYSYIMNVTGKNALPVLSWVCQNIMNNQGDPKDTYLSYYKISKSVESEFREVLRMKECEHAAAPLREFIKSLVS